MALEERQKLFVLLALILTLVGLGLMVGSFATDNWIKATAHKSNQSISANSTNEPNMNGTFGLFRGDRVINYGNGPREQSLTGKRPQGARGVSLVRCFYGQRRVYIYVDVRSMNYLLGTIKT